MATDEKLCAQCGKPVTVNTRDYELLERMHWLCFHLEFEHQGDPDAPCPDPSCPWWQIGALRDRLREVGEDPQIALKKAIAKRHGNDG